MQPKAGRRFRLWLKLAVQWSRGRWCATLLRWWLPEVAVLDGEVQCRTQQREACVCNGWDRQTCSMLLRLDRSPPSPLVLTTL